MGCRSQQEATVGKRDDGLAEALPAVHQVTSLHGGHLHLLFGALTEDLAVETDLEVNFRGTDGADVPVLEVGGVHQCQKGVELLHTVGDRGHHTEGATFFDPCGEALCLSRGENCIFIQEHEIERRELRVEGWELLVVDGAVIGEELLKVLIARPHL